MEAYFLFFQDRARNKFEYQSSVLIPKPDEKATRHKILCFGQHLPNNEGGL